MMNDEKITPEEAAALMAELDFPDGAIYNGHALIERLELYPFECEAGSLKMCQDWIWLCQAFSHLAEYCRQATDQANHYRERAEKAEADLVEACRIIKSGISAMEMLETRLNEMPAQGEKG